MDNKFNNMIKKFLENSDATTNEELNAQLQEFIKKYNNGEIEYENTPLDNAYELLEKAEKAKSKKQAIKLAKEAYELCNECFDAILFQVDLEENSLKKEKLLKEGLAFEKERLKKEKYFEKDNIGQFYGIFETRPYMRGLYDQAMLFIEEGKITLAKEICKEILQLNSNDNMGARYLLMAIYAFLEEEKAMLQLYKKYPEENLEMLFPLFALYYKLGKEEKAKSYLERINKANPHFLKFFTKTIKMDENLPDGYYSHGEASEVIMYVIHYSFLIITLSTIKDFVLENSKKKTKEKSHSS